jgi:hypothetical protein
MIRDELPELLYSRINIVEPYPDVVKPVDRMINITGFFPGGRGLWQEEESDEVPSILVLGQDFSSAEEYKRWAEKAIAELKSPTWRNLIKLFSEVDIDLKECFFSNVFMGLRNSEKETGRFPGFKDKEFVKRNLDFLSYQIDMIKPNIIVTLGGPASEMTSKLSKTDLDSWTDGGALRISNVGLKTNIRFRNHVCTCVALEHTSLRHLNVKRRRYVNETGEHCGNEAEVEMLKDAIEIYKTMNA